MLNLHLVEDQPRWRVWLVARFAQLIGVLVHVEGIPFGKTCTRRNQTQRGLEEEASGQSPTG